MGSQNCVNFTANWDYKINGTTSKLSSLNEFRLPAVSSLKSSEILGLAKQIKILSSNTKKWVKRPLADMDGQHGRYRCFSDTNWLLKVFDITAFTLLACFLNFDLPLNEHHSRIFCRCQRSKC